MPGVSVISNGARQDSISLLLHYSSTQNSRIWGEVAVGAKPHIVVGIRAIVVPIHIPDSGIGTVVPVRAGDQTYWYTAL